MIDPIDYLDYQDFINSNSTERWIEFLNTYEYLFNSYIYKTSTSSHYEIKWSKNTDTKPKVVCSSSNQINYLFYKNGV